MTIERKLHDPSEALKSIEKFRQLNVDAETADKNRNETARSELSVQITRLKPLIQGIMKQIDPDTNTNKLDPDTPSVFPSSRNYYYSEPINQCDRLIGIIQTDSKLQQIIGRQEPFLSSSGLCEDIKNAAASYWSDKHYTEAVRQAYLELERKAQKLLGGEEYGSKLWEQCFSKSGKLTISEGDASTETTKESMRKGLQSLGQSAAWLIRNPISHTPTKKGDIPEEEALEYLAVLSCLSRWLDTSSKK